MEILRTKEKTMKYGYLPIGTVFEFTQRNKEDADGVYIKTNVLETDSLEPNEYLSIDLRSGEYLEVGLLCDCIVRKAKLMIE